MTKRIVVLHSGGMDSTVCLYKAHSEGHEVHSVGIDYGQRLRVELMFAEQHCAKLGVPREVISLSWKKPERPIPLSREIAEMGRSVSPAFLPGRNILFLSIACAHASGLGADEVHIGLNCLDFSGYPDCTVQFFDAYRAMANEGNPNGPEIVAPLLTLSKPQIAQEAHSLGIGEWDTWSCYAPSLADGAVAPCGECDACRLHAFAWESIKQ